MRSQAEDMIAWGLARAKFEADMQEVFRQERNIERMTTYLANADGKVKRKAQIEPIKMVRAKKRLEWHASSRYEEARFACGFYTRAELRLPTASEIINQLREEKANEREAQSESTVYP